MKKIAEEIEEDVFKLVKASAIADTITGSVYRQGTRPFNSAKEDVVVSFLVGTDGQIQEGFVNVNIYVSDIDMGDKLFVKNISRCKTLGMLMNTLAESLSLSGSYKFTLSSIIKTFEEKEINQHFVNAKLKFQLVTF